MHVATLIGIDSLIIAILFEKHTSDPYLYFIVRVFIDSYY